MSSFPAKIKDRAAAAMGSLQMSVTGELCAKHSGTTSRWMVGTVLPVAVP